MLDHCFWFHAAPGITAIKLLATPLEINNLFAFSFSNLLILRCVDGISSLLFHIEPKLSWKSLKEENSFSFYNSNISLENYEFENQPEDTSSIVLGIRPEDILLNKSANSKEFKIELIEPMGADTLIWLSFENVPFSVRLEGSSNYKLGDLIHLEFNIKRASLFDKKSEKRI